MAIDISYCVNRYIALQRDITGALFVPDGIDEVRIEYMIKWRNLKGKRNTDADR